MERPVLYRFSDTAMACFDSVRPDIDIAVVAGKVQPGSGGISAFTSYDLCRAPQCISALPSSAPLPDGLTVVEDTDSVYLIAPAGGMPLAEYKRALVQLNSVAEAIPGIPTADSAKFALAPHSKSDRTALRFVYSALADIWRERPAVTVDGCQWDENDYAYVALLARDLESGQLALDDLRWAPEAPDWTRRAAFTAQAVGAYIAWAEAKAVGDEDLEMYIGNDKPYLYDILRLDPRRYPDNPHARREV